MFITDENESVHKFKKWLIFLHTSSTPQNNYHNGTRQQHNFRNEKITKNDWNDKYDKKTKDKKKYNDKTDKNGNSDATFVFVICLSITNLPYFFLHFFIW